VTDLRTTAELCDLTEPTDPALESVVDLLARTVPASCAGLVAYHAPGYRSFLAAALTPPAAIRTVILRSVRVGGDLRAVADWRLLGRQLFLNGIATYPEERGRSHGRLLLDDGLTLARRLHCTTLALDVSLDNFDARRLYQRMGFAERSYATWTNITFGVPGPAPAARVLDWPSFAAHRASYGFGDLRVDTPNGTETVRVVGNAMRVPAGAEGVSVATALAAVVAASRGYAIRPFVDGDGFARFARMHRAAA